MNFIKYVRVFEKFETNRTLISMRLIDCLYYF